MMIDDHAVDLPPARHLLVVRNDDRPGMIAAVDRRPGRRRGVNIDDMRVGHAPDGVAAMQVLATTPEVPTSRSATQLRAVDGIVSVHVLSTRLTRRGRARRASSCLASRPARGGLLGR